VAKLLQAAGYHTGMIGKCTCRAIPPASIIGISCRPGALSQSRFHPARATEEDSGYVTDITTDLAIQFLKDRPKDQPFFLMCHHKAPHRPWEPDARHAHLYDDSDIPEPQLSTTTTPLAPQPPRSHDAH